MKRRAVIAALYLIPFAMMYGAILVSGEYGAVGSVFGFVAGIVYAAIRAIDD